MCRVSMRWCLFCCQMYIACSTHIHRSIHMEPGCNTTTDRHTRQQHQHALLQDTHDDTWVVDGTIDMDPLQPPSPRRSFLIHVRHRRMLVVARVPQLLPVRSFAVFRIVSSGDGIYQWYCAVPYFISGIVLFRILSVVLCY